MIDFMNIRLCVWSDVTYNVVIYRIASYLGISRRQLHRIREAESAADASESEDI